MAEPTKFWYLKQFNLFSELTRDEMRMMADMTTMSPFPEKEILFFPGDTPDSVFLLKEGHVKISRMMEDGRKLTLDILNPGEIFGESAILGTDAERDDRRDGGNPAESMDGRERDTMAEAITPVIVCVATKERFGEFLKRRPDLVFRVTKWMGFRLKKIETRLESLIFKSVPARLAELLVRLADEYGKPSKKGTEIGLKLTHQELSELIASTRETTSAIIGDFRDKKWIDTEGRKIIVLNRQGLVKAS